VDEFLFLGDYISDCPYPQKTMKVIYEMREKYRCFFIRGNREDYMLNHRKNPENNWTYCSASGNLLYTYENLSEKDFDFYEKMDSKKDMFCSFFSDSSSLWNIVRMQKKWNPSGRNGS